MEKRRAIYPGSFDPITYGHIDLVKRALEIFDELIVVIAVNAEKNALFTIRERIEFLKEVLGGFKGVEIDSFEGLTVDYAQSKGARTIVRGLRATSDFDYEFQMALTNRHLSKSVDTLFLMPSESYFYMSSRLVKEIALLGGDITQFVPSTIESKLKERIRS